MGEERGIEADENDQAGNAGHVFVVHPAEHLGPPVVQSPQEGDQRSPHHHVVKVGHDEVGVVQVNVGCESSQEQARQSADPEQEDECQGVAHRCLEADGTLIHRSQPVEDFDRRGDRDTKRQRTENHGGER